MSVLEWMVNRYICKAFLLLGETTTYFFYYSDLASTSNSLTHHLTDQPHTWCFYRGKHIHIILLRDGANGSLKLAAEIKETVHRCFPEYSFVVLIAILPGRCCNIVNKYFI